MDNKFPKISENLKEFLYHGREETYLNIKEMFLGTLEK